MRTIEREIVAGHIYSGDGKLFLARNTKVDAGVVYGDCWKIPGGGVESGETKIEALIREVKEEIGIDISSFKFELADDSMKGEAEKVLRDTGEKVIAKMNFFTYKVVLDKSAKDIPVVLDIDEFDEYEWVEISDLKNFKLSPPSVELFTKLGML